MPRPNTKRADDEANEAWRKSRSQRADDHDGRDEDIDTLATEDVRDPPEYEGSDNGTQKGRTGHPARLSSTEVPLNRHDGADRADDEQVVGVGEKAHSGDEDSSAVEFAPGRLVEEVAHRDRREPFSQILRFAKQQGDSPSGGILAPLSRSSRPRHSRGFKCLLKGI